MMISAENINNSEVALNKLPISNIKPTPSFADENEQARLKLTCNLLNFLSSINSKQALPIGVQLLMRMELLSSGSRLK